MILREFLTKPLALPLASLADLTIHIRKDTLELRFDGRERSIDDDTSSRTFSLHGWICRASLSVLLHNCVVEFGRLTATNLDQLDAHLFFQAELIGQQRLVNSTRPKDLARHQYAILPRRGKRTDPWVYPPRCFPIRCPVRNARGTNQSPDHPSAGPAKPQV